MLGELRDNTASVGWRKNYRISLNNVLPYIMSSLKYYPPFFPKYSNNQYIKVGNLQIMSPSEDVKIVNALGQYLRKYGIHGTLHIFFRNKTFLFAKIESWNFQQLFDLIFPEIFQNISSFTLTFRQHFSTGNKSFVRFHEIIYHG